MYFIKISFSILFLAFVSSAQRLPLIRKKIITFFELRVEIKFVSDVKFDK
jgi:hypothetical protein